MITPPLSTKDKPGVRGRPRRGLTVPGGPRLAGSRSSEGDEEEVAPALLLAFIMMLDYTRLRSPRGRTVMTATASSDGGAED